MSNTRRGFTLIELLVVIAIIGVLVSLLLPAVQRVRESANRARCENHLHQLCIAFHSFHDAMGYFPEDREVNVTVGASSISFSAAGTYPTHSTWCIDLLPFIEQDNLFATWQTSGAVPVALYFCPSRRTVRAGAKLDYGSGMHPEFYWRSSGSAPFMGFPIYPEWDRKYSILGGVAYSKLQLGQISNASGTSNVMMLSHKGMRPTNYLTDSPMGNDNDWSNLANYNSHKRYPGFFGQDSNELILISPTSACWATQLITSSHRSAVPTVMGDGSVRGIRAQREASELVGLLWAWNRTSVIEIPED